MMNITGVDQKMLLLWQEKFAEMSSLLQRGWLFLQDSDWEKGNECFDRVLDICPKPLFQDDSDLEKGSDWIDEAYKGKLCAVLEVKSKGELEKFKNVKNEEYQKALEEQRQMKAVLLRLYQEEAYNRTQKVKLDFSLLDDVTAKRREPPPLWCIFT